MATLVEKFDIAGYCRISVDEEMDRDNTSIENQKLIIEEFVRKKFPDSSLSFFEDRDRSGYTFEQREGYQKLRPQLMSHKYDILIVKDFSRFSRRNSRGLVELEDLRDAGVRIISIGDSIDFPTYDDWISIQFRFLVNELPVTDTSKKVKSVIRRRQSDGKWICAVPYGYVITNSKTMVFEVDETAAEIVREVFRLYNEGWGYKKIANYLTDLHIPTPRMNDKERKEAKGEECKIAARPEWSIITVEGMLRNDFYIGTLRQGKYKRKKINGADMKIDRGDHIVFDNHHEPIIDFRTFAVTQEQLKKRSNTNYRGVKIHDNVYSGFLYCGDCGAPMFSMSRRDLRPAYTCGTYHKRGLKGCTSHHTRVDVLDNLIKAYVRKVKDNSREMIERLELSIKNESVEVKNNEETVAILEKQLEDAREELKATKRQKIREVMKRPEQEDLIEETYAELEKDAENRIAGLQNQIELTANRRNTIIRVNRVARTAIDIFDDILNKEKLDKRDLELIIEKILVYEDHLEIELKRDIDMLLKIGEITEAAEESSEANTENPVNFKPGSMDSSKFIKTVVQTSNNRRDKVYAVSVISNGDPLEIYTDRDGEVIFKKYSPMGELASFSTQLCETLNKTTGQACAICDRDTVISAAGVSKREITEKRISEDLEKVMEGRQLYRYKPGEKKISVCEGIDKHTCTIAAPIITEGDVSGCVVFIESEGAPAPGETEFKLAQTIAAFLSKQMES